MEEVKQAVRRYILDELMAGEDGQALTDTTPLISSRILDSIATLRLVGFLETQYGVEVRPEEMNEDYLGTIQDIARLVESKR